MLKMLVTITVFDETGGSYKVVGITSQQFEFASLEDANAAEKRIRAAHNDLRYNLNIATFDAK